MDERFLEEEQPVDGNDSAVLRNTCRVYGGIFLVILIAFCYLRRRFPGAYNLRNWIEGNETELANDQYGFISWMWKLSTIGDSEMLDECGMDALCFIRVLELGVKVSLFGSLNACWLMPVYARAEESAETDYIKDPIVRLTVSNVPSGSLRFVATVVAAYFIYFYTMYCILQEFKWFMIHRHQFLSKRLSRNYTVYIQCIPHAYRTSKKLRVFFEGAFPGSILDAHIAVKTNNLKKMVAQRDVILGKLEHAINLEEVRGVTPMQRRNLGMGESVNAIDNLFGQLKEFNKQITEAIEKLEANEESSDSITHLPTPGAGIIPVNPVLSPLLIGYDSLATANNRGLDDDMSRMTEETPAPSPEEQRLTEQRLTAYNGNQPPSEPASTHSSSLAANILDIAGKANNGIMDVAIKANTGIMNVAIGATDGLTSGVANVTQGMKALVVGEEDGEPYGAGFVTFKSIQAAQTALQMIQYPEPFAMEVLEAPDPEDVFWSNVGKTHKDLQIGKLISFGLTAALCLLWTIPMSTISTLSSLEGLKDEVKIVADMLEVAPWLEPLFAQLAPLLIIVANEVLKIILEWLSMFEGPISGAVVQASLFVKLAAFMIIQTFFVSAISGGLLSTLSDLIEQPTEIINLLANSLPTQSTFFIQILLVDTFINMGVELLRVSAVAQAFIRSKMGPNLTDKEKNSIWMGLRPISEPLEFEHADVLAGTVLYFMVFFVYSTIAPLTCMFMSVCFLLLQAGYRHQFVYIYPTFPDSGGKLWAKFMGVLPTCMIIAQVTMVGLLALKKAAIASALMFPLLIITILFTYYINQKHFLMTEFLPTRECLVIDSKRNCEGQMDFSFVRGKYVQPEFREKEVLPENATVEREIAQGFVSFGTPQNSEMGDEEIDLRA